MKQAARILNIEYSNLWYTHYTRYRLAVARTADATYSGFNMGAGEDALLELLVTVQSCPEGALVLVDEIELGLHEEAQWRLIQELKQLCSERHLQIICTTHSPRVLEALPPKARIFLERLKDQTVALTGISSAFATGKLGGRSSDELFIYVEDGVAESIVNSALSLRQRERVRIIPIGSAPAVMRQLAARYREGLAPDALAVLDGDKRRERQSHIKMFRSALESSSDVANAWVEDRVTFLPGDSWPERAVLMALGEAQFSELASHFGATPEEVSVAVPRALRASKHAEFYELADLLRVKLDTAVTVAVHAAIGAWTAEVEILRCAVDKLLQW